MTRRTERIERGMMRIQAVEVQMKFHIPSDSSEGRVPHFAVPTAVMMISMMDMMMITTENTVKVFMQYFERRTAANTPRIPTKTRTTIMMMLVDMP